MKHNSVGNIYATYDYHEFKGIPENRGHVETNGLKPRKLKLLQDLIDEDKYCDEYGLIMVNKDMIIINGHHTFEVRKRNGMAIRYIIIEDARYNDKTKKKLLNHVFNVNKINTAWSGKDLFKAAFQTGRLLAVKMFDIMDANDNRFNWYDLMALMTRNPDYFHGKTLNCDIETFSDENLITEIDSKAFKLELEYFIKLNDKARPAIKKWTVLHSVYAVLWKSRELVDPLKFRQSCLNVNDDKLKMQVSTNVKMFIPELVNHYNKKTGSSINPKAVLYKCMKIINANGKQEPVQVAL